jgi:sulfhydrogenase subunit gamma (sulfur reductase)
LENPYLPYPVRIDEVITETEDRNLKTFRLVFLNLETDDPDWKYNVGFVPTITEQKITSSDNAIAIVCGPPIMIKFTQPVLEKLGFPPERIRLSLEMRMKCGIGICGRCNIGDQYVCKDGPVFSLAKLKQMPSEY